MKTESSLSKKQIDHARRVIADPVLFASHVLGVEVWGKEAEILQSIKNNRRTAVKACHGVGKTFAQAIAVLWWLARRRSLHIGWRSTTGVRARPCSIAFRNSRHKSTVWESTLFMSARRIQLRRQSLLATDGRDRSSSFRR
jgi:hypothetical protein